jgi:predicted nucleic acid-binding protein
VAALVDTNVLVYRFDLRFPVKQRIATQLLRDGIETDAIRIAYQAVVEFHAAVARPIGRDRPPLLDASSARRETEDLLLQFVVLYPDEDTIRLAIRGAATYHLSWFDALMWAAAEQNGLEELVSEDFQHGQRLGRVTIVNPFVG